MPSRIEKIYPSPKKSEILGNIAPGEIRQLQLNNKKTKQPQVLFIVSCAPNDSATFVYTVKPDTAIDTRFVVNGKRLGLVHVEKLDNLNILDDEKVLSIPSTNPSAPYYIISHKAQRDR